MSRHVPPRGLVPVHFETALAAFFRRHSVTVPPVHADSNIERQGLLLAMALAMRATEHRCVAGADGRFYFGDEVFTLDEINATASEAYKLAKLFDRLADGTEPDLSGTLRDRMMAIMLRRAAADLPTDHGDLVAEGIPVGIAAEHAIEAAHLAEVMKAARRIYSAERDHRALEAARRAA